MATVKSSAENLTLNADGSGNDIVFQSNGSNIATLDQAGLLTATTFAGSGASLTALPAGNLTGTVADARISALTSSKLTGALPAIDGSNLTGLSSFNADAAQVFNETGNDVDFRVESNNNANMLFVDGGADKVGIGTGTPDKELEVQKDHNGQTTIQVYNATAGTAAQAQLRLKSNSGTHIISAIDDGFSSTGMYQAGTLMISGGDNGLGLGSENDQPVKFYQGAQLKMLLHTNGFLGIGSSMTAPASPLHVLAESAGQTVAKFESDQAGSVLVEIDGHTDRDAGLRFSEAGTNRWTIYQKGSSGTNQLEITDDDGAVRLAINQAGQVYTPQRNTGGAKCGIFRTSTDGDHDGGVGAVGNGIAVATLGNSSTTDDWAYIADVGYGQVLSSRFRGTHIGGIGNWSTTTTFNTSSDYRLKENEVPMTGAITRLKELKPYRFNWKIEPGEVVDGFYAHEAATVVPESVTGEKDAVHPAILWSETDIMYSELDQEVIDGHKTTEDVRIPADLEGDLPEGVSFGDVNIPEKIAPQVMDHSKLVPLLVGALQEAIERIEALESP